MTQTVLIDVVYEIDGSGRRITPIEDRQPRNEFLLFFGGSFTYGAGLNGNETPPFYAASRARTFQPYNYAFHGCGAAEMLARLESATLPNQVADKKAC